MRVGGPVDYFVEPSDKEDFIAIVKHFVANDFSFLIIGRGSNLLVSDQGFRGAAISLEKCLNDVRLVEKNIVLAEAGTGLSKLLDFCVQHGLKGLEWSAGIPGTVGGAVIMNAGAHGGNIASSLLEVEILKEGSVKILSRTDISFGYRTSGLEEEIILSAKFLMEEGNIEELAQRRREIIQKRNLSQPVNLPNSGSIFKNPPNNYAAKLIEGAMLKGKRVGGAQISEKHANFIVNLDNATANDIFTLIDLARRTVHQHTGILLELEVKLIGFDDVKG